MNRFDSSPEDPALEEGVGDTGEIEIIEIVGLDEDGAPAPKAPERSDARAEPAPVQEVELAFEEQPVPPRAPLAGPEQQDRFMRLQADFDNFRRRVDRERSEMSEQAAAKIVNRLLPVLDNFERAVSMAPTSEAEAKLRDGVALIFKQLLEELRKEGLSAVDSVGEPFDPHVHEAVATDHVAALPANTVVEELQRGYLLKGRLLRPALVKVRVDPAEHEHASQRSNEDREDG